MLHMAPTSTLELHNRALKGRLVALLRKHPASGNSYDELNHQLRQKGVSVSTATLRRWVQTVTAPDPESVA